MLLEIAGASPVGAKASACWQPELVSLPRPELSLSPPEEAPAYFPAIQCTGTGGAIAAPAAETIATGLEEGIEYEAGGRHFGRRIISTGMSA